MLMLFWTWIFPHIQKTTSIEWGERLEPDDQGWPSPLCHSEYNSHFCVKYHKSVVTKSSVNHTDEFKNLFVIHVSHFCVIAYLFVYSTYVSEPCYQGMSQIGTIAMHMYLLLVSKCSCWFVFCTRYLYTCSQSGHRRHPKHTLTKTEETTR